ncbi:MAG: potassium transporter TrkG [Lachnospiraceae bacterium]|nr:potassium transporter TrkG [Lachnospiraceae bacterium]
MNIKSLNINVLRKKRWSSFQIIIAGFLAVILIGSLLLMLPFSSRSGEYTSFLSALFTATSATCVTGLVVYDTATHWSAFGQAIILILIQIGGMGVVTIAVSAATISGKKIGLMQRSTMQEAISAPSVGGIVRLTGFILKSTILIESIGAILMLPVFLRDFGIKGIWYSIFHSISAFCNAGFDLMGNRQQFSSLTAYSTNGYLNTIIMGLIIIGGIGFITWDDIRHKGFHFKQYRLQSKIALIMASVLIIFPFLFFFFREFSSSTWNNLTLGERIWAALFQAVTPRTAGFNTVDLSLFSEAGQTIIILLMLIGGSPGSTAGGMKTTTIAVLFMNLIAVFKRKEDAECLGRRIEGDTIKYASTILMMYLALFLTGGIIISCAEGLPMMTCLFETASAIGTVGLTLGITPHLGLISRIILIILMFMGRVGCLTLVFAAFSGTKGNVSKLPREKITVG